MATSSVPVEGPGSFEVHKASKSKLFIVSCLTAKDGEEERLEKCHNILVNLVSGLSEREIHDALNQAVCKGVKEHEEISLGLLYSILTESATAPKTYRDLSFISRDAMGLVVNKLFQITTEKFHRLMEGPKIQILWLLGEMMKNAVNGLEPVVHNLLRNIAGGDTSANNIWLTDNVFNLIKSHKAWLDKNIGIFQLFLFKYLRLVEDHDTAKLKVLRQNEVDFLVALIKEKFVDCIPIGRDFVRLLQNIFRIPEFQKLWKDILHRPQTLSPQFTGLPQILSIRTSRKFLSLLITPDMETKIGFLALKVKFGNQKRYQEWFFRQYLSGTEGQTLIPDLVRFICGVIHPPNEVLCSDIIPRWAIMGWLYTACQNHVSQANMKLSLFFDWLFFQGERDNIMNIEPAVLLMYNSLRTHASMTYSLLDFICRMTKNYCPQYGSFTQQGVHNSWKSILDKRVVSSLSPILKSNRMDKDLRNLINETFPSFVGIGLERQGSMTDDSSIKIESPPHSPTSDLAPRSFIKAEPLPAESSGPEAGTDTESDEAVFSDEDDEEKAPPPPPPPPATVTKKDDKIGEKEKDDEPAPPLQRVFRPIRENEENTDINEMEEFQNLDSNLLKDNVLKLKNDPNDSSRCEAMEAIISYIESMGDFDDEMASPLCTCIATCLADDLVQRCLPKVIDEKNIESSLENPKYVIFRSICSLSKNDINRDNLYVLLHGIHEVDQKIGYHFLYFIKACYNDEEKFNVYEDYVSYFKDRTMKTVLTDDLRACHEYDPLLFMFLIETICRRFSEITIGHKEIIHLLTSLIHPDELNEMINKIILGQLTIIGENQVGSLLDSSLSWTSFEQSCLWSLINAEDIPVEMLVGVLPELKRVAHCEAMSRMLLLLKAESPSVDIIKPVLCMDPDSAAKSFSLCLMKSWCHEEARELSHILSQLLTKPMASAKRRLGNSSTRHNPSVEQIVLHLNILYKHLQGTKDMGLFKYEALRYALTQAKKNIIDPEIKIKCKALFGEFTELPDRLSRKRRVSRMTRSRGGRKKDESSEESESDEDEDDDEDNDSEEDSEEESPPPSKSRTPVKKRRKTTKAVSSDEEDD